MMQDVLEQPRPPSSEDFKHEVERAIFTRTGGQIRNLRVHCGESCITMHGDVPTYYLKQLASHAVLELGDSVRVTNEIEVR